MTLTSRRAVLSALASVGLGMALSVTAPQAASALNIQRCVSSDNHVYMILWSNSDQVQVNSVAMTNMNANACCELPMGGDVITAVAAGGGSLLPNRARTTVISGLPANSVTCAANFNATAAGGQGQLTLPGGVRTVSAAGGAFSTEGVVPVTTADAAVPAAFDVPMISRSISGCSVSGETMSFPSTAGVHTPSDQTAGEVSGQTATYDDTEGSTFGNRAPGNNVPPTQSTPDGFKLEGDCSNPATCELIVFIATQNGATGAGISASAFSLTGSDITDSTECAAQGVLFNTPTRTPTSTQTATATASATATVTATATNTPVPTATASTTGTITQTPTVTPTPTPGICSLTPRAGCSVPVGFKRRLRISAKKDVITWRWRSNGDIPLADFGNPVTTSSYSLCIYTGVTPTFLVELHAPEDGNCGNGGKPCWKARSNKGFRYRDPLKANDGISRIALRTKPAALADLVFRARGPNVPIPTLPLTEPVLAQLVRSDGPQCWESHYSAPALRNTADVYKDKND